MTDPIEVRLRDATFCFDGQVLEVFGYGREGSARYRVELLTNFTIDGDSLNVVCLVRRLSPIFLMRANGHKSSNSCRPLRLRTNAPPSSQTGSTVLVSPPLRVRFRRRLR